MIVDLENIKGFLIDLDGTIFKGNEVVSGARDTIQKLHRRGKSIVYLSNRGNISRDMALTKLQSFGIDATKEEIILTSFVAADFLKKHYSRSKLWVLGEQGLVDELCEAGLELAREPEESDWLVVTLHESLTYEELNRAFRAVKSGARIIATNSDPSFPREDGDAIDVGGMIGAIEATTHHRTDIVVGKPSHYIVEVALSKLGLKADECMVIGDSLGSDMALGKLYGFQTTLVLTGNTKKSDLDHVKEKPNYIIESIGSLLG